MMKVVHVRGGSHLRKGKKDERLVVYIIPKGSLFLKISSVSSNSSDQEVGMSMIPNKGYTEHTKN